MDTSNNSLMRGIQDRVASTSSQKQLELHRSEMKQVINMVTAKFTELLKKNKMLGVEILFRWPSREIKDQILNNYDRGGNMNADNMAVE
jgi:hypothetical protein